jgi:DNA transformation protein
MFGGYGLNRAGTFSGIIYRGRLYFTTDSMIQPSYHERGMKPFRPNAKQTLKNYYEVPAEIIEEPDQLVDWTQVAIRSCRPAR